MGAHGQDATARQLDVVAEATIQRQVLQQGHVLGAVAGALPQPGEQRALGRFALAIGHALDPVDQLQQRLGASGYLGLILDLADGLFCC